MLETSQSVHFRDANAEMAVWCQFYLSVHVMQPEYVNYHRIPAAALPWGQTV